MQGKIMLYTVNELQTISPIVGQIIAYTDGKIPEGWLPCDGRMLRRHDYPELFKVISTTYGDGDGSNTAFNLPNMVSSPSDVRHIIFAAHQTHKSFNDNINQLQQFRQKKVRKPSLKNWENEGGSIKYD